MSHDELEPVCPADPTERSNHRDSADPPERTDEQGTAPAARFAGVPESTVRSLLRYSGREGVALDSLAARFGEDAPRVLEELIARGLVARTPQRDRFAHALRGREWIATPTEKLYRLASAQKAVVGLIEKVRLMAARPHALFVPRRVIPFGEILGAPPTLRSVDVGIDLADVADAAARAEQGAAAESQRDRRKTTPVEWLAARRRGVWYLAGRSPVLRLLPLAGDRPLAPPVPREIGLLWFDEFVLNEDSGVFRVFKYYLGMAQTKSVEPFGEPK